MPSFLVTKRMSPALAARVLESVSGRRQGTARKRLPPLIAASRLLAMAALVGAVGIGLHVRDQRSQLLQRERDSLLDAMRAAGGSLTRSDRELRARVQATLSAQAGAAHGVDEFASELRSEPGLKAELELPTLYVRGPLEAFTNPTRLEQAASSSFKDAFLLCLLEPPAARTETSLKAKARAGQTRTGVTAMAHVERVDVLLRALPLLDRAWQERVRTAETSRAVASYEKLFAAAPIRAAVRAAKARQLLAVMDEPGDPKAAAELDGERPHPVRVVLTDLNTGQVRLRYRGTVDPSWLSAGARAEYASGIDSCALALDLRSAVLGRPQVAAAGPASP